MCDPDVRPVMCKQVQAACSVFPTIVNKVVDYYDLPTTKFEELYEKHSSNAIFRFRVHREIEKIEKLKRKAWTCYKVTLDFRSIYWDASNYFYYFEFILKDYSTVLCSFYRNLRFFHQAICLNVSLLFTSLFLIELYLYINYFFSVLDPSFLLLAVTEQLSRLLLSEVVIPLSLSGVAPAVKCFRPVSREGVFYYHCLKLCKRIRHMGGRILW